MSDWITWPDRLRPARIEANIVPLSRSGGVTLGGIDTSTRTDRGYWSITFGQVPLGDQPRRQLWNAVRTSLGGRAGLIAIPVWSKDSAPYVDGVSGDQFVPHDDFSSFDDGALYDDGGGIEIRMDATAALGATVIAIRRVTAGDSLAGIRFSYNHALYETGLPISISGEVWTVPVFPAIRAAIPEDAELECERPTCLVHLAGDREMDVLLSRAAVDRRDVVFVEATDYWNALAGA